jgi:hypothetical protein
LIVIGYDLRNVARSSHIITEETGTRSKFGIVAAELLLAYMLGVAEYWHFANWHGPHIQDLYNYQNELLQGHAPWVADQNRVLAPLLIEGIQRLFQVQYEIAYQYFMFWTFIGMNVCMLVLLHQCRLRLGQIIIGLLLAASVPLLLFNWWWFPWTNLEVILFLLAFAVDASIWRFRAALMGVIFLAMVITKESCVFLPIWLFLRFAAAEWMAERQLRKIVGVGIGCFAMILFALVVDIGLRRWLWVSGTIPNLESGLPADNLPHAFGTHILLFDYPARTLSYLSTNALALMEIRMPWPLSANSHWTDWPMGSVVFLPPWV